MAGARISRIESGATERIQAKLAALPDALQEPIRQQIDAAGQQVLGKAQQRVPVDLGELKKSIKLTKVGPFSWTIEANALSRRGRIRFNYAWFVEFGTNRNLTVTVRRGKTGRVRFSQKVKLGKNARPFLFPAFRQAKRNIIRDIGNEIRRVLQLFPTQGR